MKRSLFLSLAILSVFCLSTTVWSSPPVKIEVLYMNHGPLQDTLAKLQNLLAGYGDRLDISWHDFESNEGEAFKAKKGINQHVPLVIWINGNPKVKLGQQEIMFWGFPSGAGPAFFQGKWSMDNLKQAIENAIAKK